MIFNMKMDFDDRTIWYKPGTEILHREDGPAVEYANGDKFWYKEGTNHRLDGPAIEYYNGTKKWYKEGLLHREDGPAIEYFYGNKCWYVEGILYENVNSVEELIIKIIIE